jgi:adenylate cyclase
MSAEGFRRKLSAILSADVAEYSRLMRDDEEATVRTLNLYKEMVINLIEKNHGRLVDSTGDNLLAEFLSVVEAVRCAVQIQEELKEKNKEQSESRKMEFRIGINLGDVIQEGDRIYGDGVNVTARIESLANRGGICISQSAYEQIKNKLNFRYEYLGEHQVKNIDEPVRVYKVLMESEAKETISELKLPEQSKDKPSIAVLPFVNMSGDKEQEYFSDGVTEDIITALSKIRWFLVIARNSTFSYKGKSPDVRQVASILGVRYVLEGSVRKAGNRVRISAQLIEGSTGNHVWAERYDQDLDDIFAVQDEITRTVIGAIEPELTKAELRRAKMKRPENLDAWDLCQRGWWHRFQNTKEDFAQARQYFQRAIDLDPQLGSAYSGLSEVLAFELLFDFTDTPLDQGEEAVRTARKGIELDPEDARARISMVRAYSITGQTHKAIQECTTALKINPNYATAHFHMGTAILRSGRAGEAIPYIKTAIRLSPNDIFMGPFLARLAHAHLALKEYEKAVEYSREALSHKMVQWGVNTYEVSALGHLGRLEEAREALSELLRRKPDLKISHLKEGFALIAPDYFEDFLDGLRKAGLPEGSHQTAQEKPSIAVLPFINMSNDPEQEYFSDGMSEELIGALAKLQGLKVISRTSAFHFKGKDTDLRAIGEKLKVEHVLEGSVRKAGNKLRISAQLIKVDDDTHLWSETYDRELKDVFSIQDEISQAIVKNLKVKLLSTKTEPLVEDYTKNTEAYELFLKGRFFNSKGFPGFGKTIEYYEKTIKADPGFAPAYSKLAMTHWRNALLFSLSSKEMWTKVKTLTLKALEINGLDADAHASLGLIKSLSEYDWPGAEINFKRAIELNPGNSEVHLQYAIYLIGVGRANGAIEKIKRALELDPFSVFFNAALCMPFLFTRQYDKAISQAMKTLELAPNHPDPGFFLGINYGAKGMYDEGIKMLQQISNMPLITANLGYLYGKAGRREEAQNILGDLLERYKQGYFSPNLIARVYCGLGDSEKVFEWLEKAFEERDAHNWCIKVEPNFDDVHSDPRWTKLMEKMGLAD